MKVLLAARMCRPDLLVAITRLASKVSAGQKCHDRALRRLFQYIAHHADLELVGSLDVRDKESFKLIVSGGGPCRGPRNDEIYFRTLDRTAVGRRQALLADCLALEASRQHRVVNFRGDDNQHGYSVEVYSPSVAGAFQRSDEP